MIPDLCIATSLDNSFRGSYGFGSSLGGAVLVSGILALTVIFLCWIGCLFRFSKAPVSALAKDSHARLEAATSSIHYAPLWEAASTWRTVRVTRSSCSAASANNFRNSSDDDATG